MATAAPPRVKSQPLHNFSLSFLKWGASRNNHTNCNHHHHCCRRPPVLSDHTSEPDSRPQRVGWSRTAWNRFTLPSFSNRGVSNDETGEREQEAEHVAEAEAEETVQKPWNLRPRKPAHAKSAVEIGTGASRNNNNNNNNSGELQEAAHHHNGGEKKRKVRKEKRKLCIALSKEEIEEDIFGMTGSRPSRRPRKWPKNVQKQMDCLFPGLCLVGKTADDFN